MSSYLDGIIGGSGLNAYSTLSSSFVQPAVGANVSVVLASTAWAGAGLTIFVEVGGSYQVVSISDATHMTIKNLGGTSNAAPGATVPANGRTTVAGSNGASGAAGKGLAAVRLVQTGALPTHAVAATTLTATANGALDPGLFDLNAAASAVPGVLGVGDRVLVSSPVGGAPTSHARNGIYAITALGSAGAPWILTRASDLAATADFVGGAAFDIVDGRTLNGTRQQLYALGAVVPGTTLLLFDQVRERPLIHWDLSKPPYNVRGYDTPTLAAASGVDNSPVIAQALADAYAINTAAGGATAPNGCPVSLHLPTGIIPCKSPIFSDGAAYVRGAGIVASTLYFASMYGGPCIYIGKPTLPAFGASISANTGAVSIRMGTIGASTPSPFDGFVQDEFLVNLSESACLTWVFAPDPTLDCRIWFKPLSATAGHIVSTAGSRASGGPITMGHNITTVDGGGSGSCRAQCKLRTIDAMNLKAVAGAAPPAVTLSGATITGLTLTFSAAGSTVTRSTGNWLTDNAHVGESITFGGTASNNYTATISAASATVLTLSGITVVNEGPTASCTAMRGIPELVPLDVEILSATTFRYSLNQKWTWVPNTNVATTDPLYMKDVHTIPNGGTYGLDQTARGMGASASATNLLNFPAGTYAADQRYSTVQTTTLLSNTTMTYGTKYEIAHVYDGATVKVAINNVSTNAADGGTIASTAQTGKVVQFPYEETFLGAARNLEFGGASQAQTTADMLFGGIRYASSPQAVAAAPGASLALVSSKLWFVPFDAVSGGTIAGKTDGLIRAWRTQSALGFCYVYPMIAIMQNAVNIDLRDFSIDTATARPTAITMQCGVYFRARDITIAGRCNGIRHEGPAFFGGYANLEIHTNGIYGLLQRTGEMSMSGRCNISGQSIPVYLGYVGGTIDRLTVDNQNYPDSGVIINMALNLNIQHMNVSDESSNSQGSVGGAYPGGMVVLSVQSGQSVKINGLIGASSTTSTNVVRTGASGSKGEVFLGMNLGGKSRPITTTDSAIASRVPPLRFSEGHNRFSSQKILTNDNRYVVGRGNAPPAIRLTDGNGKIARAADYFNQFVDADLVSTSNIALTGLPTVDGVTATSAITRLLLVGQTNPAENGIWIPINPGSWIRALDLNVDAHFSTWVGKPIYVKSGATLAGASWRPDSGTTLAASHVLSRCFIGEWVKLAAGTLTAARTYTIMPDASASSDMIRITVEVQAFDAVFVNGGPAGGTLFTVVAGTRGSHLVRFDEQNMETF